jgi:hypothetical protein
VENIQAALLRAEDRPTIVLESRIRSRNIMRALAVYLRFQVDRVIISALAPRVTR